MIGRRLLDRLRGEDDEASNVFPIFVVMLPLLVGAFGLGVDMSHTAYVKNQLQNVLDIATVSGAGVTTIDPQGRTRIVRAASIQETNKIYKVNREGSRLPLVDRGSRGYLTPTPATVTSRTYRGRTYPDTVLTFYVTERVKYAFLPVLGLKTQDLKLVSRATVNQSTY